MYILSDPDMYMNKHNSNCQVIAIIDIYSVEGANKLCFLSDSCLHDMIDSYNFMLELYQLQFTIMCLYIVSSSKSMHIYIVATALHDHDAQV